MNLTFTKLWPWFVGGLAILLYVLPWLLAGKAGYVRVHDSLDSLMAWHKIMAEHKFWFAPSLSEVGPIFKTGIPRISYPTELSVIVVLFAWLDPYWAYVSNQFLLRLLALSGMYVFLRSILSGDKLNILIAFGVALCYAFLPYWAWAGGSVAALPWVFYVLMRCWQGHLGTMEIIVLVSFPFYSSIVLTGMYIIGFTWLLVFFAQMIGHQVRPILIGAIITSASHLIVDYRLLEYMTMRGFISHRVDFVLPRISLEKVWSETLRVFRHGDGGAVTLHDSVIFYTVFVVLILAITHYLWRLRTYRYVANGNKNQRCDNHSLKIAFLLATCFSISVFCGFWYWGPFASLRGAVPILEQIQLTRISLFLPFLWMVAFALALATVGNKGGLLGYFLVSGLLVAQLWVDLSHHEYLAAKKQYGITYEQFFSETLFDEIAKKLPNDRLSYVVGSIGIHPSIAQYNGFRTADAYLALYPKEYKVKFRKAVIDEFARLPSLQSYFDDWGSRVYFFSSQLTCPRNDSLCTKSDEIAAIDVNYNIQGMRDLSLDYLFSLPIISNADQLGFVYIGSFENSDSPWRINIYKLLNQ